MNERIRELAEQAELYALDKQNEGDYDYFFDGFQEKFAELIVRDCTNVIRQEWFKENNAEYEKDSRSIAIHAGKKLGLDSALDAVTNHFGVE